MKRSDLLKKLNSLTPRQLVEIYRKDEDESFSVGYIIDFDINYLKFVLIDDEGKMNGIDIFRLDAVATISINTEYIKHVEIAQHIAKVKGYYNPFHINISLEHAENSILISAVKEVMNKNKVILLGTCDEDIMKLGKILRSNTQWITLGIFSDNDFHHYKETKIAIKHIDIFEYNSFETLIIEHSLK